MSKMGQYFLKLCEDAEIMTQREFINEWGEQYLDIYKQIQENNPEYDDE